MGYYQPRYDTGIEYDIPNNLQYYQFAVSISELHQNQSHKLDFYEKGTSNLLGSHQFDISALSPLINLNQEASSVSKFYLGGDIDKPR
jgi:hypothetical protein